MLDTAEKRGLLTANIILIAAFVAVFGGASTTRVEAQDQGAPILYSSWAKNCINTKSSNQICFTRIEGRESGTGMPTVVVAIIEAFGAKPKVFRVAMSRAVSQQSVTRVRIDCGGAISVPPTKCMTQACVVDRPVNDELIGELEIGATLWVWATDISGRALIRGVPLGGFSDAYKGPPSAPKPFKGAPYDPKYGCEVAQN